METVDTREFFEALFPDLNGHYLEIRRLPGGKQDFCTSTEEAAEVALSDRTRNIYFGVALRSDRKGDEDHAALVPGLWADFDWKHFDSRGQAGRVLGAFEYPPTIVVETGGGWQPYWLFKEPEQVTDESKPYLRGLVEGIGKTFGLDSVHDLARILRVPGSIHAKDAEGNTVFVKDCPEPKVVKIIRWHPERRYNPSDFNAYLVDERATQSETAGPVEGRILDGHRNNALTSLAGSMQRRGMSEQAIASALLVENQTKCDPSLPETEVRNIARSVARYEPTSSPLFGEEWSTAQPLPDALPPVEPFVLDLLPAVFQPWICDIAERMQCPPDFPAVGVMLALSAVVGRQVAIRPKVADDWQVVPNLWGGVVGRPGLLKTPTLQEVLRPLDLLEGRARGEYETAQREFEAEKMVRDARQMHTKDKLKKALRAGQDPYQVAQAALINVDAPPTRQRYRTNDPTMEKLGELLNENPRGLLLFRDELTGFLRALDREGRESDRAFYLEAWNGTGQFVFDRIGRGTIDIQAACISVLGGIQPGPLSSYMGRAARGGQDDDGLVQRFQLVVWPDPPDTWQNIDRPPNVTARQCAFDVFERLDRINPAAIGAEEDDSAGFLPFLRFTPEAQEIFTEWRTDLEHRLLGEDLPPMLEAHLAKFRSLIPSLALLFHLADTGKGPVREASLLRACAWSEYLESHAQRVYAPSLSPSAGIAEALADRICRGDLGTEFSLHDVYHKGWLGLGDREEVQAGLELLEDLDWVRKKETRTEGRTRTRYLVNPRIGEG